MADATGEALSSLLRAGNAGANTVADHLEVLDAAIAQLPAEAAAGHRLGDDADLVSRRVIVRTDSAGCNEGFLVACRDRNVGFFVTARRNAQVEAAIFDAIGIEEVWLPAVGQDGEEREGCAVAELTSLVTLDALPTGTRLIVRREPLHAGPAQPLPVPRLPLLGFSHRPGRRAGRPRRHHTGPRPRRSPHRPTEGLGEAMSAASSRTGATGLSRHSGITPSGSPSQWTGSTIHVPRQCARAWVARRRGSAPGVQMAAVSTSTRSSTFMRRVTARQGTE